MRNSTALALAACGLLLLTWVAGCGGGGEYERVISGRISGVADGVLVRLITPDQGVSFVSPTAPDGSYAFRRIQDGAYEIVPSSPNYAFDPPSLRVTVAGEDVGGNDFTATALAAPARFGGATAAPR